MANDTKERILKAGLKLWPDVGPRAIGRALDMSHARVLYYFGNAADLSDAIANYAVAQGNSKVIVQLIAVGHSAVRKMKTELRHKYVDTIR